MTGVLLAALGFAGTTTAQEQTAAVDYLAEKCRRDTEAAVIVDNTTGRFWDVTEKATERQVWTDQKLLERIYSRPESTNMSDGHCHPTYSKYPLQHLEDSLSTFTGMVPSMNDIRHMTMHLGLYFWHQPRGTLSFFLVGSRTDTNQTTVTRYGLSPDDIHMIRSSVQGLRRDLSLPASTAVAVPDRSDQYRTYAMTLSQKADRYARAYGEQLAPLLRRGNGIWRVSSGAAAVFTRLSGRLAKTPVWVAR